MIAKTSMMLVLFLAGLFTVSLDGPYEPVSLTVSSAVAGDHSDDDKDSDDDSVFQVTLCHFPPGTTDKPETLTVGTPALVNAHLAHGDFEGECPCLCPPGVASCVCGDGKGGLLPPATSPSTPTSQRSISGK